MDSFQLGKVRLGSADWLVFLSHLPRYISAILRDPRFRGKGHIAEDAIGLASADGLEGSIPVINAVDVRCYYLLSSASVIFRQVLRLLIVGDVGGV